MAGGKAFKKRVIAPDIGQATVRKKEILDEHGAASRGLATGRIKPARE